MGFARTLADMGASVSYGPDWIEASGVNVADGERLKAFDTDFNLIPDAAMTAAALALYADGPCRLRNIGSWRVKRTVSTPCRPSWRSWARPWNRGRIGCA